VSICMHTLLLQLLVLFGLSHDSVWLPPGPLFCLNMYHSDLLIIDFPLCIQPPVRFAFKQDIHIVSVFVPFLGVEHPTKH